MQGGSAIEHVYINANALTLAHYHRSKGSPSLLHPRRDIKNEKKTRAYTVLESSAVQSISPRWLPHTLCAREDTASLVSYWPNTFADDGTHLHVLIVNTAHSAVRAQLFDQVDQT